MQGRYWNWLTKGPRFLLKPAKKRLPRNLLKTTRTSFSAVDAVEKLWAAEQRQYLKTDKICMKRKEIVSQKTMHDSHG